MHYILLTIQEYLQENWEERKARYQRCMFLLSSCFALKGKPSTRRLNTIAHTLGREDIFDLLNDALQQKMEQNIEDNRWHYQQVKCLEFEIEGVTKRILAIPLPWGEDEKQSILHLLGVLTNRCKKMQGDRNIL